MTAEQSVEAVEIVTMAVDKYSSTANYEVSDQSCLVLLCYFRWLVPLLFSLLLTSVLHSFWYPLLLCCLCMCVALYRKWHS